MEDIRIIKEMMERDGYTYISISSKSIGYIMDDLIQIGNLTINAQDFVKGIGENPEDIETCMKLIKGAKEIKEPGSKKREKVLQQIREGAQYVPEHLADSYINAVIEENTRNI